MQAENLLCECSKYSEIHEQICCQKWILYHQHTTVAHWKWTKLELRRKLPFWISLGSLCQNNLEKRLPVYNIKQILNHSRFTLKLRSLIIYDISVGFLKWELYKFVKKTQKTGVSWICQEGATLTRMVVPSKYLIPFLLVPVLASPLKKITQGKNNLVTCICKKI